MPTYSPPFLSSWPRIHLAILCGVLWVFQLTAADFTQPEPLQPEVAEASGEAAEAMEGIRIPAGWTIQLFAAEPDVANVVAFDIDNRGRIFACESFRQNRGVTDNRAHDDQWLLADLAAETVQDRIDYHKRLLGEAAVTYAQHDDRIRRLEDSDGDGKVDQSYVVVNGFNHIEEGTGAGVLARGNELYYTCIPKLWKLIDKDDNGIADERIAMSDGYGVRVAFRGHDMHGLVIGPDGRLYFSIGDRGYHVTTDDGRVLADPNSGAVFRCELDGTNLEVFATGLRNPQELAFNDVGELFSVDNNSDSGDMARIVQIVEGGDTGWRMHYQYLPDRGPFNREKLWEPFHQEQPAYIVPPITNFTDGPSGLAYYPGTGFGDQLKDNFLICDFRGGPANSGIRSFRLEAAGAFYQLAEDSDPIWTVLATDAAFGPDGALYVSDWVDGWNGLGKGRIYRISDPQHSNTPIVKEVQRLLASDWKKRTSEQLNDDIGHVDRRIRYEAQWELARRADEETLVSIAADQQRLPLARLHAIWGSDQIARSHREKTAKVVDANRGLLESEQPIIRAAAAKLAGERGDDGALESLRKMLDDSEATVRYQAAVALSKLKDKTAFGSIVKLLATNDNQDPMIRHAGILYLHAFGNAEQIAELSKHKNVSVRRAAVVALRRLKSQQISLFLADSSSLVSGEAARGIYDAPIPVAMKDLAGLIEGLKSKDIEFVRRILNANFRLGGREAAENLADFAGRPANDTQLRIEALEMLESWSKPDPRDRILNAYRPLKPREQAEAAKAIAPQIDTLMASESSVREKAIDVAAQLGVKKIVPMLVQRIVDDQLSATSRANSLEALTRLDKAKAVNLARQVKMVPPNDLLITALRTLSLFDSKESLPRFIEATQSRDTRVSQLGWDILAKQDHPDALASIVAGVQAYLDGSLPSNVHLNVLEAAQNKLDGTLQDALLEHNRTLAEADTLANWLTSLDGGDEAAGKKIFFEKTQLSCVRCHKVDRAGGEVGPVLTVIGKEKDRRYLLEAICLPDAKIAKGFETAVIANEDGQVFTGIVKSENDDYVELIQNDGAQQRILLDEIVARRKGKSSMPDDLTKFMTPRELRDLVAYLASLKVDPRDVAEETE